MSLTRIHRRVVSRGLCSDYVRLDQIYFKNVFTLNLLTLSVFSFEKSEFEITVDGVPHMIKLYDTAGQEEYDQLRKTIYKHVIILNLSLKKSQDVIFHF